MVVGVNALRVLAQVSAAEQIVGRERNHGACHPQLVRNVVVARRVNSTVRRNNRGILVSKQSMRKVSLTLLLLSLILVAALPSQAQRRSSGRQIKLSQTASKTCISNEETEGCAIHSSAPEPETGIPNSKVRCSDCVVFGKVIKNPAPCYPHDAKAENISGEVQVKIVVDELGKVIWAKALSGHQTLQQAAERAACRARFTPSTLIGRKIKVKAVGVMTYKFKLP